MSNDGMHEASKDADTHLDVEVRNPVSGIWMNLAPLAHSQTCWTVHALVRSSCCRQSAIEKVLVHDLDLDILSPNPSNRFCKCGFP